MLAKLSFGTTLVALTVVFVGTLAERRGRCAVVAAAGFAVAFLGGWIATGQDLAALPDYVKNGFQISSGYAPAMGINDGMLSWEGTAAVVSFCLGMWAALHATAGASARQRTGVVLMWVVTCFFAFKEGFVRHDSWHGDYFFQVALGGFFAFSWRATHRLAALACVAALLTFALAGVSASLTSRLHVVSNAHLAVRDALYLVIPSRRAALLTVGREEIQRLEPIDPQSLALLRGQTVAPYPIELSLAWAYGLRFDPIPVLQSYSAYTSALDGVDARFLESSAAPQRILLQAWSGIDNRVPSFDQGLTNRTMLCRYRLMRLAPPLAVLGRAPSRCTGQTLLQTIHADWGTQVPVPPPPDTDSLVFVRIDGVDIGGLEQIRSLLFKPKERFVELNGASFYRLVPGTAADGLPLTASPGIDYPAPFNMTVGAKTIAVAKQGSGPSGGAPITFSFYAERFASDMTGRRLQ